MTTLIIDSRDKASGTDSNFKLNLTPAIHNAKKIKLLFANVPTSLDNEEPFYLITIPQFSTTVSNHNGSNVEGTFIVPITSAGGFRSIHQTGSDFPLIATNEGVISMLDVRITNRFGVLIEPAGDMLLVIQLEY
jgi:hypothetical protein